MTKVFEKQRKVPKRCWQLLMANYRDKSEPAVKHAQSSFAPWRLKTSDIEPQLFGEPSRLTPPI